MWTMIITLSITALLLAVFVIIMIPRPKFGGLEKSFERLKEAARMTRKLDTDAGQKSVKKLLALLTRSESRLNDVVDNGLVEVKAVAASVADVAEIVRSLVVVKAPPETVIKYADTILRMLSDSINKLIPFVNIYKTGDRFTLSAKSRAESVLAKLDMPDKRETPEEETKAANTTFDDNPS